MFPCRRTASRTLYRSRSVLTAVYRSSTAIPAVQTHAKSGSQTGTGLTAAELPVTGAAPACMGAAGAVMAAGRTASVRGSRLSVLSMENGKSSRTATKPQSSTLTHFGARFRQSRSTRTAAAIQLAETLIWTIFKKSVLIVFLLFGCGRSSAAPRRAPARTDPAAS